MQTVFGWRIRWQGPALESGFTLRIGTEAQYLALYCPADLQKTLSDPHGFLGRLNHMGVCVRNLVACDARAKKKWGSHPVSMRYMNQGRGFIFEILTGLSMQWSAIPLNSAVTSTGPVLEAFLHI